MQLRWSEECEVEEQETVMILRVKLEKEPVEGTEPVLTQGATCQ